MKLIILSILIVSVLSEPPRFRPGRFRFQRIELAPSTTDAPMESTTDSAPYPASGWKPAEPFALPNEAPSDAYGPPAPYPASGWQPSGEPFTLPKQQSPPSTSYGTPDTAYGAPAGDATTTANPQAEKLDGPVDVQKSTGAYYVLLPNGQLQRVDFATENDVPNMKYTAKLQLRNPAPLFVFGR